MYKSIRSSITLNQRQNKITSTPLKSSMTHYAHMISFHFLLHELNIITLCRYSSFFSRPIKLNNALFVDVTFVLCGPTSIQNMTFSFSQVCCHHRQGELADFSVGFIESLLSSFFQDTPNSMTSNFSSNFTSKIA